jgi:murein L,D-transpeptidase YcbB/YkuD
MGKRLVVFTLLLWLGAQEVFLRAAAANTLQHQISAHLRQYIEMGTGPLAPHAAGGAGYVSEMLQSLYAERLYRPAWSTNTGLLPQADILLEAIRNAEREGLRPADYFLSVIEPQLAQMRQQTALAAFPQAEQLAAFDLLLSAALISYGTDLLLGRLTPGHDDSEARAQRVAMLRRVVYEALETGQIDAAVHSLLPLHAGYHRLRQALAHYRQLAARGGWPSIADGPLLRLGDRHAQIRTLRQRLSITGELVSASPAAPDLFDETLEQAVRAFQERHGLDVDGVVGPTTRAALNVPVDTRVQQIVANMERWRQLPQHLGARYLVVNIPNFTLDVVEQDRVVMSMRTVVGTPQQRTPVFSALITSVVLSPYWRIPFSIARQEILPRLRREPGYLATQRIKIWRGQGAEAQEVDARRIDWSAVTARHFDYSLRQEPGPDNALGRIKFLFPNAYSVYMHDTPQRTLFSRSVRAFSHGCVRLEQPIALAEYLLRDEPYWTRDKILATIARGVERYVLLPEAVPVHLVYWTAWITDTGTLHFRPDIYGHDTIKGGASPVAQQRQVHSPS